MIDELPDAPDPATDSPTEFNAKAAASVLAQKNMVPQINAALGAMSAFAAGGAYAFQYAFDSATADADPGVGKLRLGSATQNASAVLRVDNTMAGGKDLAAFWTDLVAVTSSVKGSLRLVKSTDVSKWMILDVTGSTAATGYRNLAVTVRVSSDANPFQNGEPLMMYVQRGADKGDTGNVADFPVFGVSHRVATAVGGGATTANAWVQRPLNTVGNNEVTSASLSGNSVILPAGKYEVFARAAGFACGSHQIRLRNPTTDTVLLTGSSAFADGAGQQSDSVIAGKLILATSTIIQLEHFAQIAVTNGLGIGLVASSNSVSIHSQVQFRKVG